MTHLAAWWSFRHRSRFDRNTRGVTAGFEYNDRAVFNKDSGQPASIDLTISGNTVRIFIEAKLENLVAVLFFQAVIVMEGTLFRMGLTAAAFTTLEEKGGYISPTVSPFESIRWIPLVITKDLYQFEITSRSYRSIISAYPADLSVDLN